MNTSAALLPREAQLDHHPLVPFVVDQEMAVHQNAAVVLKVWACDRLVARIIGVEGRGSQDDVLAVERAVALTMNCESDL